MVSSSHIFPPTRVCICSTTLPSLLWARLSALWVAQAAFSSGLALSPAEPYTAQDSQRTSNSFSSFFFASMLIALVLHSGCFRLNLVRLFNPHLCFRQGFTS